MARKNHLTKEILFDFLYSLIQLAFIIFIIYHCYIYGNLWYSAKKLNEFNQQEYVRIKIYGNSSEGETNTVSASFSIVDTNGNEIAAIERSWSGSYLAVDFAQTKINGKYFVFPYRIYGKDRIMENSHSFNKGISLEKYYDDNYQCMLLGYGSTLKEREYLYNIARFATKKIPVINIGYTGIFSIDLSDCKSDVYYSISKNTNGKLSVIEL